MKLFLGIFLVLISAVIIVVTYYPIAEAEIIYQLDKFKEATPENVKEIVPLYPEFGIVVPKLKINSKVIKNVNPFDANIYQKALTQGVAHAKGTALPGDDGNIFIFSHSSENFYEATRYNSIFYLLSKLEMGDTVTLYYQDERFDYNVAEKKIVTPDEVSYLSYESDKPQLTLMTCYPPGTNLKRLIIVANQKL